MTLIFKQIPKIMLDVEPISKERKNQSQGYQFRGIDDCYEALQTIMAKHGVFTVPEVLDDRTEDRQSKSGGVLIYRILKIRYHFYAEDGSSVQATVIGEGQDSGDKASNKAMSVAHKYALLQVFCIPTKDPKDPENDSHELKPLSRHAASQEPHIEVHDKLNREHNRALAAVLTGLGIPEKDWARISLKLHGKPKTEESLDHVIKDFKEDFGIPFGK